jgi:hypothetical protein
MILFLLNKSIDHNLIWCQVESWPHELTQVLGEIREENTKERRGQDADVVVSDHEFC